jgi:hypothetical protein
MPRRPRYFLLVAIGLAGAARPLAGQAPAEPAIRYQLAARLDPDARSIAGQARITWRNATTSPVDELRFELPWNARRNDATTWARDRRQAGLPLGRRPGHVDLTSLSVATTGEPIDLLSRAQAIPGDDGNQADGTLWRVPLGTPLPPGQQAIVELAWTSAVPDLVGHAGEIRSFFFVTGWYPRVGIAGPGGWTARETRANRPAYGPPAQYDVELRVPAGWTVAATSPPLSSTPSGGGEAAHRFSVESARDFAWATGPDLVERRDRFTADGLPAVDVRVVLQREHAAQGDRLIAAAKAALGWYGRSVGQFPWPALTLVDVPRPTGDGDTAGRSYGGLVAIATRLVSPWSGPEPERAVVGGIGDVYVRSRPWPDSTSAPWLGESLSAYISGQAFEGTFAGRAARVNRYLSGIVAWPYPAVRWHRTHGELPRETRALITIERMLGRETALEIVRRHLARSASTPTGSREFVATATSVSGRDVSWLFDSLLSTTETYDYAVGEVSNSPHDNAAVASTVLVQRLGSGVFPVEVRVAFEDGSSQLERWDGREGTRTFTYDRQAPVVRVEVDPDHVLALDTERANISWTARPSSWTAARRDLCLRRLGPPQPTHGR